MDATKESNFCSDSSGVLAVTASFKEMIGLLSNPEVSQKLLI